MQLTLDQAARNPDRLAGIRRRSTRKAQRVTIEEKFRRFHAANGIVYDTLVRMAREVKASGLQHYGIKALYEVARYKLTLEYGDRAFKMDNNYTAHFARLIMEQEEDLAGFFSTRERRAD